MRQCVLSSIKAVSLLLALMGASSVEALVAKAARSLAVTAEAKKLRGPPTTPEMLHDARTPHELREEQEEQEFLRSEPPTTQPQEHRHE